MPYSNVPDHLEGKMERCVSALKAKGRSGDSVYKICYSQVVGSAVKESARKKKGGKK